MLATLLAAAATSALPPAAHPPEPPTEAAQQALWAADRDQRMAWWREARFGMFIHWGLYSGAGGRWDGKVYEQHYAEWIQHWAAVPCGTYAQAMKPRFRPEPGCTEAWADLAKKAGMRYAVMTAKHHEGFTLFNSREPYSVANPITGSTNISPPGRDLAKEFADAMRSRGLRAGFYYSLLDWQHPDAYEMALPGYPKPTHPRDPAVYKAYVRAHIGELLRGYGPLCTIWFDYSDRERQGEAWGAAQLMADLREAQPGILVNNRLYEGLENKKGDYGTPEKYVPPTGLPGMDWEVNHTLNESYGYSDHDKSWKSTKDVVRLLADVVSKGGNLLLNIGPDASGAVPAEARATLEGVGGWMSTHGEAIYGTTASPFRHLPWGRATRKAATLYVFVFDWPADGVLRLPMKGSVKSARFLDSTEAVVVKGTPSGVELRVPKDPTDPSCPVLQLDLAGGVDPVPYTTGPGADGSVVLTADAAELSGPSLRVERPDAKQPGNLGYWNNTEATASWGIDLPKAGEYHVVADIACADAAAGADVEFTLAGTALPLKVPATGGWQSYRTVDLGVVKAPAGSSTLTVRAKSKPGEAVLNIRTVRLAPR